MSGNLLFVIETEDTDRLGCTHLPGEKVFCLALGNRRYHNAALGQKQSPVTLE